MAESKSYLEILEEMAAVERRRIAIDEKMAALDDEDEVLEKRAEKLGNSLMWKLLFRTPCVRKGIRSFLEDNPEVLEEIKGMGIF